MVKNRRFAGRAAAIALCCLAWQTPAQAAKSPLISGTETAGEAEGPALEAGDSAGGVAAGAAVGETGAGDEASTREAGISAEETGSGEDEKASAFSEEELNDSRIEYAELEALIRRGNSTAVNLQNSYENSLEIYQSAYDSLLSARRDMLNKADELEDEGGDDILIAAYEQNASILSSSAKQMKRSINSLNSASSESSRDRSVWSLVKTAQALLVSCKEMEDQAETAQKTVDVRQADYDKKVSMRTAGLATEDALLEAEKSLLSAQISLQSTLDGADKLKRQLAVMIGKEAGDMVLGEVPAVTGEELAALNLEEDKAKAVIADSNVKSIKRTSATGDAGRKLRRQQLTEAEASVNITADEQYREAAALSLSRDAAAAAFAAAEKDYGALQAKYRAGLINKSAYLSGVADYYQKKAEKEAAEMDLRAAVDAYGWLVRGVN